eukprot:TRINITY_DN15909_c0_g1_i1.p3 TRINITY_DN15909_c0_g1~~TRINITY_DN15909_c0_g1_i1.p3  ORF type:complete len:134 (+),score=55.79 TRINITY_DN15909_c0_g1_i1:54-404(+)
MRTFLLGLLIAIAVVTADAKSERETRCGSDSDCVMVHDMVGGGKLLVDGLDLSNTASGETIAIVEERLPGWFGPKRPLKFSFKGKPLDPATPLAQYKIKVAEEVQMTTDDDSAADL